MGVYLVDISELGAHFVSLLDSAVSPPDNKQLTDIFKLVNCKDEMSLTMEPLEGFTLDEAYEIKQLVKTELLEQLREELIKYRIVDYEVKEVNLVHLPGTKLIVRVIVSGIEMKPN